MNTLPSYSCFVFVIKTDSYAGNFERQMCGYMTGQTGECGVGDEGVSSFIKDHPGYCKFEDSIALFPDDCGCYRPTTIWGSESVDVAIFFESQPTKEQLTLLRKRAIKFAAMTDPLDGQRKRITILGFELRDYRVEHTDICMASWD